MITLWIMGYLFPIRLRDMIPRNHILTGSRGFMNLLYLTAHFGIMTRYIQGRVLAVRMKLIYQIIMMLHKRAIIYVSVATIKSLWVQITGMVQVVARIIIISATQKYC